MNLKYYPTSPAGIPKNFTALTSSYQLKTALAIFGILLFFALYFGLVATFGYIAYATITGELAFFGNSFLLNAGVAAGSVMLFIFTLKFIFKIRNLKPKNRIKLNLEEQEDLKDFIYQICDETGAPKPKSVYIDPDVNAYVSYTNVWLSLIFPTKKELTLGLGLISSVNLSEFKAITAHEFGHFAQRSMKIGSYILSANTIIHDMIFTRDRWDNLLAQWRNTDIRLSAAAWIITPIIWLIRQLLRLFYQFLNIMYSSLSREMEFNADKVAVSVTGSDAIVSGLWKLDNGVMTWSSTVNNAYLAAKKNYYVKNLYLHNNLAQARTADAQQEILNNLPKDSRGGKMFFSDSAASKVNMYASHPPNDHRENNAKIPYIPCKEDKRSPWVLFAFDERLQEQMTALVYEQYLAQTPKKYITVDDFENFIKAEAQGKELLAEYFNTFENRYINLPEEAVLVEKGNAIKTVTKEAIEDLKPTLKALMKPVTEIENLMIKAQEIAQGKAKETTFSFNNKSYDKKNLEEGYNVLVESREKIFTENFNEWDSNFCTLHYALAKQVNRETVLLNIYKQHQAITTLYKACATTKNVVLHNFQELQTRDNVYEEEVSDFARFVNKEFVALNKPLNAFDDLVFVPLSNIDDLTEFKEAIVEGSRFNREIGKIFENGGFGKIVNTLEAAAAHCQRIEQKSIAAILALHKELQGNL